MISLFVFPLIILPIIKYGKKMKRLTHETQDKLSDYTKYLNEKIHNVKLVKALGCEDKETKQVSKQLDGLLKSYKKVIQVDSIMPPIMEMISYLAIAGIIFYGGYSIANKTLTPGSLFSFISAFIMAYKPVKSIANMNIILQGGIVSAKRVFSVLDHQNVIESRLAEEKLKIKSANIKFENVSFEYEEEKQILKDLSFDTNANRTIAIVGESGSGKSTIVDLLLQFYNPKTGRILIDGQDTAKLSTKDLREHISVVTQENMLFDTSILENIIYGSKDYEKNSKKVSKDVIDACVKAHAHNFIEKMPNGYHTIVGKFGLKLSGGQKQRIAIARAILKRAPIMIFDEATSSLDQVSEKVVQQSIIELKSAVKSLIFITHRLSTIQNVDVIYVIKNGKLVESGTHESLIRKKGEYNRLYNKKIIN